MPVYAKQKIKLTWPYFQLICSPNELTGFYMMGTLVVKRLKISYRNGLS